MIFNLFERVVVKVGDDEKHIFDRGRLMYTEVIEIERVSGLSYLEWEHQLGRYSMTAIAPLLHVLRKRDGQASDFGSLQFNARELDVVPLKEGDVEMTGEEIRAELARRVAAAEAENGAGPGPTPGGDAATSPGEPEENRPDTTSTNLSSLPDTASGPGSGNGSPGVISPSSKPTLTGT